MKEFLVVAISFLVFVIGAFLYIFAEYINKKSTKKKAMYVGLTLIIFSFIMYFYFVAAILR